MSAISDHLRQVAEQLTELAELMERQAAELEYERHKVKRLAEMVDRGGASLAEKVILRSADQ